MRFRSIHFLLLAALVYWTSGAAMFLHERIEHAEPDGPAVALQTVADSHADAGHSEKQPGHHHDHDDCPTCQLLAHMQAAHVAPPAFVSVHLPAFSSLHLTPSQVPSIDAASYAPIRGPPMSV